MRKIIPTSPAQLRFDAVLAEAESLNRAGAFERTCGHLPAIMAEAVPFYRSLIEQHHAAMLDADIKEALRLREEAGRLALRLNNGEPGILAGPEAPGCQLARLTAAETDTVPFWGQVGSFIVELKGCSVRTDMDGLFGIGARFTTWMNFCAHAVDWKRPFISSTGFRSFMGINASLMPGLTTEAFAVEVMTAYVQKDLKGRLVAIEERYRRCSAPCRS